MIETEGHPTTMEKVLHFAAESFLRLVPKIQVEVSNMTNRHHYDLDQAYQIISAS